MPALEFWRQRRLALLSKIADALNQGRTEGELRDVLSALDSVCGLVDALERAPA